jgi:xanthine dehydrogenase accessory factor
LAGVQWRIGLDIGAETPREIAVSILAEIIVVRRGKTPRPSPDSKASSADQGIAGRQ